MENKKRLIDANELLDFVKELKFHGGTKTRTQAGQEVLDIHIPHIVAEIPTVDAVVLPCEIGREVFYIWSVIDDNDVENFEMSIGKVSGFSIQGEGVWAYCRYEDGLTFWHKVLDDFGRVVFLTREEAETALAKMDGDGNG